MKIICMDCQTESYSDVEGLKGKKRLSCAHCDEQLRSNPDDKMGERMLSASDEDSGFYSSAADEFSFEGDNTPSTQDMLEVSDPLSIHTDPDPVIIDDVVLFPEHESIASLSDEEPCVAGFDSSQQILMNHVAEGSGQLLSETDSSYKPLEPEVDSPNRAQSSNESLFYESGGLKRVRLITVSTSKLTVIAAAFVLFIALVEVFTKPSGKVSVKTENPPQAVNAASSEVAHSAIPVPAQTPQINVPTPSPTPAVTETIPVSTTPSTDPPVNQQIVEGKALFTIQVGSHKEMEKANEQAEKLRAAGFEPRVVSVEIPKRGIWYRVQVGDFTDRDQANRYGSQILAKGAAETFVISGL